MNCTPLMADPLAFLGELRNVIVILLIFVAAAWSGSIVLEAYRPRRRRDHFTQYAEETEVQGDTYLASTAASIEPEHWTGFRNQFRK